MDISQIDITQIIITIGLVIAGLFVLWAIIAGIFAYIGKRTFEKQAEKMDRDFEEKRKNMGFKRP